MPGIWVSENQYLDFDEAVDRSVLSEEIAVRSRAFDWGGFFGIMPDPDPVLRKLPDGGVAVLESLTADGHLCSVIQSRKLGSLKKEFKWNPGSLAGEEPTARAERLAENLAEDLENVDLYNLLSGILDAPYYGMTPMEIKWAPGKGRMRIVDLPVKPARWFGYDEENTPKFLSMDNPWDGEALPFGKFVFARHFPTYDNPYGLRLLSRCFWPAAFKKGGIKFWMILAEKYGIPFLLGKHRQGATGNEKREMLSDLTAMVADAVAVIPEGGSVEILERKGGGSSSSGSTGGGIHAAIKSAMDAEMSKVIMGQTLTAEVSAQGGSRAQGQVHEDILETFQAGDQTLVKIVMEEIAWVYGQVNAPGVPSPKFAWFEESDPKKETAERDKTLGETGVRFRKTYYMRTYDLNEDDFDIDNTQAGEEEPAGSGEAFAEPGRFTPEQQTIEDVADEALAGMDAALGENEAAILAVIEGAESYEDAVAGLLELYPDLDVSALSEMVARLWFNAALYGRAVADEEAR